MSAPLHVDSILHRLGFSLLVATALGGCVSPTHLGSPTLSSPPPTLAIEQSFRVRKGVTYTPSNWPTKQIGDLYLPDNPANQRRPAVLLLHGGAWTIPEQRVEMNGIAKQLAAHGYVVFNATYRLTPRWKYPVPVEDLREALKWLRAQSDSLQVDPHRIAAFGYSAGGHLAAMLGMMDGPPETSVQAVVAGGAPSDMTLFGDIPLVALFLGGDREEIPAIYHEASPVSHVDSADPPVFLYHGSKDLVVPARHSERFYSVLAASEVPRELYWIHHRHHVSGFFADEGAVETAIGFLDRVLKHE